VKSHVLQSVLVLCVLLAVACAEPESVSGPSSTIGERAGTTEGTPATTSTLAEPTTTSTTPTTSSVPTTSSPTTLVPIAGGPPQVTLKPPGYSEILPIDEVDDYFIFHADIARSYATRYTMSSGEEATSIIAHVDDGLIHFIAPDMGGELMMSGADVWVRSNPSEAWVLDEEMFELPFFLFFASPDYAYAMAYQVFEDLEFTGWIEVAGESLAVYRGGAEAAAKALDSAGGSDVTAADDGLVEAWWSVDGYFPMVRVELSSAAGSSGMEWKTSEVGTTEVEPPA